MNVVRVKGNCSRIIRDKSVFKKPASELHKHSVFFRLASISTNRAICSGTEKCEDEKCLLPAGLAPVCSGTHDGERRLFQFWQRKKE